MTPENEDGNIEPEAKVSAANNLEVKDLDVKDHEAKDAHAKRLSVDRRRSTINTIPGIPSINEEAVSGETTPVEKSEDVDLEVVVDSADGENAQQNLRSGASTGTGLGTDTDYPKLDSTPVSATPGYYEYHTSESIQELLHPDDWPKSYQGKLPKEELVLMYADNFRRQYVQLYRDRKPLLLNPVNEFNEHKFVSTTIRPTLLPYKPLYSWDGCSEFIADYLNFRPLDIPYELPMKLFSPTLVMKRQLGNCFEYSTVLVSLLIGAGYDAYVVSGYAQREVCLCDNTRETCNLLQTTSEEVFVKKVSENLKYQVKPPKDLRSKFILKMEARKEAEEKARLEQERIEEERRQLELEKPPPDPLYGMRIHSWILVLSGKREVPESFFIEPFTGQSQFLDYDGYHGIESLWNHQNYWVNMQDCSNGVKDLSYDLGDCTKWEYLLPGHDKAVLTLPEVEHDVPTEILEDEEEEEIVENYLDMPVSWVLPIEISLKDYLTRCPQGKKTWLYKKAKLEKFAPYLMDDGLVTRLCTYEDRDLTEQLTAKEFFKNRADNLDTRLHDLKTGLITECFFPGRPHCLKEHSYLASSPGLESNRTMLFYNHARVDGLQKRVETPTSITEDYVGRDDFLYYVFVEFSKRTKTVHTDNTPILRSINKMVQKFYRNTGKDANDDTAEIVYLFSEDKIMITYHLEDSRIAASTREFTKPSNWAEKGAMLVLTQDMHSTFQVATDAKPTKQVDQFLMFLALLKDEHKCKEKIRESEDEVKEILELRTKECDVCDLTVSVYDTERNETAKQHRIELERKTEEMRLRKREMELDYLAPFLAQIGHPEKVTRVQAYKLKEDCLNDLKQRLIDRANLIQARFEKETQELQKKQQWYQQNQMSMQKVDEEDYLNYCSEAMFRIHILELRLNRHKEMAPHKYMAMEQKLRTDPRLMEYF